MHADDDDSQDVCLQDDNAQYDMYAEDAEDEDEDEDDGEGGLCTEAPEDLPRAPGTFRDVFATQYEVIEGVLRSLYM